MSEVLTEALIEFTATFTGIGLALFGEYYLRKRSDAKRFTQLHEELRDELQFDAEVLSKRAGNLLNVDILKVDIWDSVISAGELKLIERTEKRELSELYYYLKGFNYEADKFVKTSFDAQFQENTARFRLLTHAGELHKEIETILEKYFKK